MKSDHESGTDYSDDVFSEEIEDSVDEAEEAQSEEAVERTTIQQRRQTFYQSHIFPMHLLSQLKVFYLLNCKQISSQLCREEDM